jgi:hypothetical protein
MTGVKSRQYTNTKMIGKKINQLATELAPATTDLTIIGDPTTGVSKKITLSQIANLFATSGTVTSVAVTETGDALTITGSPITTAGTINIGFAGAATQYVRGDGQLSDFPTSTGGGSSVSYYLNSSVSQGTLGGVAYRQFSKTPIAGAGTDISVSANGYIASYITDANDPALLEVPAGNFNCELYFSVNSNNHNPYIYAEVYKYDGTTFTLLGSSQSVPEYLTNGTTLSPYYFAVPVTATVLTITDRIAIRIYANVDGRTVTLHTENNHLCQVVTTFSKGLTSLNNLTRQVQFLATGTSGTDFNIASSTATHTFNLPTASATNRGALSSADWTTFNNKQNALTNPITGTGASGQVAFFNGTTSVTGNNNFFWDTANNRLGIGLTNPQRSIEIYNTTADNHLRLSGNAPSVSMGEAVTGSIYQAKFGLVTTNGQFVSAGVAGDFVIISQTGATIIGTSSTEKMRVNTSGNVSINNTNDTFKLDVTGTGRFTGQLRLESTITDGTNTYTLPSATGTLALTSQLTGGTVTSVGLSSATSGVTIGSTPITTSGTITLAIATASGSQQGLLSSTDWTTFNNKQNALTNPVTGTGTTNYLPKFTGASTIGDSVIQEASSNIGIGGSPSTKLHSFGTIRSSNAGNTINTELQSDGVYSTATDLYLLAPSTKSIYFYTNNAQKMLLDASGNLGLGVSPSAWSGFTAMQVLNSSLSTTGSDVFVNANCFFNGSNWRYIASAAASQYYQDAGSSIWRTAPSGTAGNAISFTQAMTLDASGNLMVGTTTAIGKVTFQQSTDSTVGGLAIVSVDGNGAVISRLNDGGLTFRNGGSERFRIASTGAATFSSSVTATTGLTVGSLGSGSDAIITLATNASGAPRTIYYKASTATINFTGTGGTDLMTLTNGGNLGIGTTSPSKKLDVFTTASSATEYQLSLRNGAGANSVSSGIAFGFNSSSLDPDYLSAISSIITDRSTRAADLTFLTAATGTLAERMRITSGGLVGIGTSAPGNYYSTKLVVAVGDEDGITIAGGGDNFLMFADGQTGLDRYRGFIHYSHDTNFLAFGSDGAERMRITSGGDLIVGATSIPGAGSSTTGVSLGASGYITAQRAAATVGYFGRSNDGELFAFYNNTTQVGNISVAASSTSYNTSSDYRLKQDLKDFSGLDLVTKIKTYDYEWKADKTRNYGVIAHELQSVINYAVTGVKDGKEMQGVDYSKIVPVLIKAIQELNDKIK